MDLNIICGKGIHYFLDEECARTYETNYLKSISFTGKRRSYNNDGSLFSEATYENGLITFLSIFCMKDENFPHMM